jgi:outer membrane PBP1 activator LpoA protein
LYDAGSDPEAGLAAYAKAVADGADLVIGPLGRDSVAALFERAQITTPLLALNRGGESPPPPGSVSFALAPEDEGIAAAYRMLRRGWTRVIAAAGEDENAQRTLAAFREHFTQRDGVVVAEVRLPESAPDYAALIRNAIAAAGTRPTQAPDGSAPDPSLAPATTADADAIFLAARGPQARLFAPQLRVAGVYDLPIIATSTIAGGGGNARMDRELDGIEFTELPWLVSDHPGLPAREPLAKQLETARGAGARLFAFGMDAFRLAGQLEHLASDPNAYVDGATGNLRLDGFGQVQRTPAWARFSNGYVQPAPDGGLTSDGVEFRP